MESKTAIIIAIVCVVIIAVGLFAGIWCYKQWKSNQANDTSKSVQINDETVSGSNSVNIFQKQLSEPDDLSIIDNFFDEDFGNNDIHKSEDFIV